MLASNGRLTSALNIMGVVPVDGQPATAVLLDRLNGAAPGQLPLGMDAPAFPFEPVDVQPSEEAAAALRLKWEAEQQAAGQWTVSQKLGGRCSWCG